MTLYDDSSYFFADFLRVELIIGALVNCFRTCDVFDGVGAKLNPIPIEAISLAFFDLYFVSNVWQRRL